jgi:putative transposase
MRTHEQLSVRRLAAVLEVPSGTVGRWVAVRGDRPPRERARPVSGDMEFLGKVKALCEEPMHRTYGHRRIRALLRRRYGIRVSRETVLRAMRKLGLVQPRIRRREARPKRVEKMRPTGPNESWQIDMTSLQLSDLNTVYLVAVIDCYTRQVVGWSLDRRCRASEWVAAVRMGLEGRGLVTKESCAGLVLRSDNGCQPCSRDFREYLSKAGVRGQYTGYDAPDDNGYVERLMRTIKEEEVWANVYDSFAEAHAAIDRYVRYYNAERIHSALRYQTPDEVNAAANVTLVAA